MTIASQVTLCIRLKHRLMTAPSCSDIANTTMSKNARTCTAANCMSGLFIPCILQTQPTTACLSLSWQDSSLAKTRRTSSGNAAPNLLKAACSICSNFSQRRFVLSLTSSLKPSTSLRRAALASLLDHMPNPQGIAASTSPVLMAWGRDTFTAVEAI